MQLQALKAGFFPYVLQAALALGPQTVLADNYSDQPQVQTFIDMMVDKHGFEREELVVVFNEAQRREDILELMRKPAEKRLQWHEYRKIFLTPARTDGGVAFWKENAAALSKAEAAFGVAPQVVVAIIGVETRYGSNTGRHRVLDALSTLAFDYPPRSEFFTGELEQYLLLAREEDIDVVTTTGSYAGAMGGPQFISSSYRAYAADGDGDGRIDLWQSWPDVFASVANYFKAHKWQTAGRVVTRANGDVPQTALSKGLRLDQTPSGLSAAGVEFDCDGNTGDKAMLFELEQENGPEYWVGFQNFYVITRYNRSAMYAMAVYQLATELAAASGMATTTASHAATEAR